VRRLFGHAVRVALEYETAAMHDRHAIGVGFPEERVERERGLCARQRAHARRIVRDVGRRDELAHVVECPAVAGRGAPIGKRDLHLESAS
jgi:hypothetical protein